MKVDVLSREGATDVLRRLCTGKARFKELNETVPNTRTLTRRLGELVAEGLIQKSGLRYNITDEGFNVVLKIAGLQGKTRHKLVNYEELNKIRYEWMRISLGRLIELLLQEFGDELISVVIYGSSVKDSFRLGRSDIDLLYILEDDSRNVWQREGSVFKSFQSTWEYRACDYWLKTLGSYGYPEVTTVSLQKGYAETFQLVYLDMLHHRAILYDREEFVEELMKKLEEALKALGTIRVEYPDGTYAWFLKPDIKSGELIEIRLG